MGFLKGGPFYHLVGRTGNNVGRVVKGKNVFAMRPAKSSVDPTQLQIDQRFKFGLIATWLRRLAGVIDVGFKDYDAEMSPRNAAISYNLLNAVTGVSPNYTIDYEKVVYSRGLLDLPNDPLVAVAAGAKINYTWAAPVGDTNALGTDKVTFMVYNAVRDKFVTLKGIALRSALAYSLQLPLDFSGEDVEIYLSFVSADGKLVSDSLYMGNLTVL
jgi:hypothetical protein